MITNKFHLKQQHLLWRCFIALLCVFISNQKSEVCSTVRTPQVGVVKSIVKRSSPPPTRTLRVWFAAHETKWVLPSSIAISTSLSLQPVKPSQTQACKILRFAVPSHLTPLPERHWSREPRWKLRFFIDFTFFNYISPEDEVYAMWRQAG